MIKRSIRIRGHQTALSLEGEFWQALGDIAVARGISRSALITEIDDRRSRAIKAGRRMGGLSSAVRVVVLEHFRGATEK